MMIVKPWSDISKNPISIEPIREIHPVDDGYRLFPNCYSAGVKFPVNITRAIRVYVLSGNCRYLMNKTKISISDGHYADLQPGDYEFEVGESAPVKIVKLFKLPSGDE
jgi:hypothetical protein